MKEKNEKYPGLILDAEDMHYIQDAKIYLDSRGGYYTIDVCGKREYLHRYLIGAKKGETVDHINRNRTDNRKSNLRIVSKSLNAYNKEIKNNLGRGIYYDNFGYRYRACISHNNKTIKLGSFQDIEQAKIAYNKKALEIYGKDAFQHEIKDPQHFQLASI